MGGVSSCGDKTFLEIVDGADYIALPMGTVCSVQ